MIDNFTLHLLEASAFSIPFKYLWYAGYSIDWILQKKFEDGGALMSYQLATPTRTLSFLKNLNSTRNEQNYIKTCNRDQRFDSTDSFGFFVISSAEISSREFRKFYKFMKSVILIVWLTGILIAVLVSCLRYTEVSAHIVLTYPPARTYALDYLDNIHTPEPCGMPKGLCRVGRCYS